MNKKISIALVAFALSLSSIASAGTIIKQSELPKAAQTFISKYFPKETVRKVEKDQGRRGEEYEVDFNSGAEIDFKSDGSWKEVKASRGSVVPEGIIPAGIAKTIKANYSGKSIIKISGKRGGYEVKLSDGTELRLTEDGKDMPAYNGNGQRGKRK